MRPVALLLCVLAVSLVAICVLAAELARAAPDLTAPTLVRPTLHLGSRGQRVCDLQWLLSGHSPSAYTSIRTYYGPVRHGRDCLFGPYTKAAVRKMKYRLGWPQATVNGDAGWVFVGVLRGQLRRPIAWIATGARRQRAFALVQHRLSACENRIVRLAESQVGVTEQPYGSNWGPQVARYQAVTGQYHAAWCASFAQWVLLHSSYGTIADRSAYVPYIDSWGYRRGLLRSSAHRGELVLFLYSASHIGIVETARVVHNGVVGFTSIEGNWANRVARVFHPYNGYPYVFLALPHCSPPVVQAAPRATSSKTIFGIPVWAFGMGAGSAFVAWLLPPPRRRRRDRRS